MQLKVNGLPVEIAGRDSLSVDDVLAELKVSDPLYVTVELNGEILDRGGFAATRVKGGDVVEFLYFMGGGRR
jgi:sulfur carrier protein